MRAVNMQLRRIALVSTLGCLLSACVGIPVSSDVNGALASSVQCHTFAWAGAFRAGALSATLANPVNEARLRSAIQMHLESLGARNTASSPDCLVGYGIGRGGVMEDWAWGPGWGPYWGPPYWGGPYFYPEALVAVDLYDARSRQPIWHASARLAPSSLSGEHAQQGIDAAVTAIFSKYLH